MDGFDISNDITSFCNVENSCRMLLHTCSLSDNLLLSTADLDDEVALLLLRRSCCSLTS